MRVTWNPSRVCLIVAAAAGFGLAAGSSTHGAEFATDAGGGTLRNGHTQTQLYAGTLGTEFTVGSTGLVVSTLGFYDGPNAAGAAEGDGLLEAHQVGIFTSGGTLLGSATVPAGGGTLVGDFRYVAVSPITLDPNTTYILGGQVPSTSAGGDTFRDAGGGTVNQADLTVVQGRYTAPPENPDFFDGQFEFPASGVTGGPGLVYYGPSFQYALVPEPAALGLLGVAGLGLLARRRRRA